MDKSLDLSLNSNNNPHLNEQALNTYNAPASRELTQVISIETLRDAVTVFTDAETKAQRGPHTCPRSHS